VVGLTATGGAKRLFGKIVADRSHPQPRVINTDQASIYISAMPGIQKSGTLRHRCGHRMRQGQVRWLRSDDVPGQDYSWMPFA
jgi:transposase-like protein